MADATIVQFMYRNYRGEVGVRTIRPIHLWFGSTGWHPSAQWLLECYDLDKQETRDYALSGILSPWYETGKIDAELEESVYLVRESLDEAAGATQRRHPEETRPTTPGCADGGTEIP